MVLKGDKEFAIYGKQEGSVREETNAVSGTTVTSVQDQHPKPLHPLSHQHKEVEVRRENQPLRGRSPSQRFHRQPCKDFLEGICTKLPCDNWYFPECQFISQNRVENSAMSTRFRTGMLSNNKI